MQKIKFTQQTLLMLFICLFTIFFSINLVAQNSISIFANNSKIKQPHKIKVSFQNDSGKDLYLAVSYIPYNIDTTITDWNKAGWFLIKKGTSLYVFDTYYSSFYYYAESAYTDFWGKKKYWAGDNRFEIRGKVYGFRLYDIKPSNLVFNYALNESTLNFHLTK